MKFSTHCISLLTESFLKSESSSHLLSFLKYFQVYGQMRNIISELVFKPHAPKLLLLILRVLAQVIFPLTLILEEILTLSLLLTNISQDISSSLLWVDFSTQQGCGVSQTGPVEACCNVSGNVGAPCISGVCVCST